MAEVRLLGVKNFSGALKYGMGEEGKYLNAKFLGLAICVRWRVYGGGPRRGYLFVWSGGGVGLGTATFVDSGHDMC